MLRVTRLALKAKVTVRGKAVKGGTMCPEGWDPEIADEDEPGIPEEQDEDDE